MRNEWVGLASEIILSALEDIKHENPQSHNYKDAIKFFESKWFAVLAHGADIHPDRILRKVQHYKHMRSGAWYFGLNAFKATRDAQMTIISDFRKSGMTWRKAIIQAWEVSDPPKKQKMIVKLQSVQTCAE